MALLDATRSTAGYVPMPGSASADTRPTDTPASRWDDWDVRTRGRWRWQCHPAWTASLFGSAQGRSAQGNGVPGDVGNELASIDWLALGDHPHARRIKSNDGREVWRVDDGHVVLFVKISRPGRRWARSQRWLFGSAAAREWRVARYAAEHDIATVMPIAAGEAPQRGREPSSVLVTLGVPDARSLNEYWASLDDGTPGTRAIKNEVIDVAANLIARAHQNGFKHYDLHAGNVLIEHGARGHRALFVDLPNVRIGRTVRDKDIVHNLAQFNQWFRLHATLSDRMRFFRRYWHWHRQYASARPFGRMIRADRSQLLRWLRRAARRHANGLYLKRDRRVFRDGRYFARLRLAKGWRGFAYLACKHEDLASPVSQIVITRSQWRGWFERPVDWVSPTNGHVILKQSRSVVVYRARLDLGDGRSLPIVCKRAVLRNIVKRLQSLFRPSRPMLAWKRANALLHRQIPTARPLAVLERRWCGLLLDSLILTEFIPHTHRLDKVLAIAADQLDADQQRRFKRELADALARTLRRLHERGFTHRDLKATNVLVQWDPQADDPPCVRLIDLDGLRCGYRPSRKRRFCTITRLNVSLDRCPLVTRTDRLRFLKRYLVKPGHPEPSWKPAWREAARLAERKRCAARRKANRV